MKIQENTNHKAAESNSEDITMRKQRRLDLFESELNTILLQFDELEEGELKEGCRRYVNGKGLEEYPSQRCCASVRGISYAMLKQCKNLGAPGFDNTRVKYHQLVPWLRDNIARVEEELENSGNNFWRSEKLKYDAKHSKLKYEELLKSYILREEAVATMESIARSVVGVLRARLEVEQPQKLAGADVPTIKEENERIVDEICSILRKPIEEWA